MSGVNVGTKYRIGRFMARQGNRCALCEMQFRADDDINLDHIIPRSKGGSDLQHNLQATHVHCNSLRGDMSMIQWRAERSLLLNGISPSSPAIDLVPFVPSERFPSPDAVIAQLMARVDLLERANRTVAADWKRLKEEIEAIKIALGPWAYAKQSLADAVKELKKRAKKPNVVHDA